MSTEDFDPRLRMRLWADGELMDETWLDGSNEASEALLDSTLALYGELVMAGRRRAWTAELYDPNSEQSHIKLFRPPDQSEPS